VRHACAAIGSATASTLIGRCNTSIKRVARSLSVPTVELYANPVRHTSVVIVVARKPTTRVLVRMTETLQRKTVGVAMVPGVLALSRRSTWIRFANPTLMSLRQSPVEEGPVRSRPSPNLASQPSRMATTNQCTSIIRWPINVACHMSCLRPYMARPQLAWQTDRSTACHIRAQ
jgi:hypothetical protein